MSRASTRVSIRWLPEPASETTDTLVLSVGGYYVDLRVKKSNGEIDWALTGERIVSPNDTCKWSSPLIAFTTLLIDRTAKVQFTHIIDSHHNPEDPNPAPDVGQFTKLANGDDLEIGEMPNPDAGGKIMAYEEVWRELDWSKGSQANNVNWILESMNDENDYSGHKAFYAKLGKYYLAVRKMTQNNSSHFAAVRQDFDAKHGKWIDQYTIGEATKLMKLGPYDDRVSGEGQWQVGATVNFGDDRCIVRAITIE